MRIFEDTFSFLSLALILTFRYLCYVKVVMLHVALFDGGVKGLTVSSVQSLECRDRGNQDSYSRYFNCMPHFKIPNVPFSYYSEFSIFQQSMKVILYYLSSN
jgi:hypothetical protein